MGSNTGQSAEGPIHPIWLDAFGMAATQVTVEEYTRFLEATRRTPPPLWNNPDFSNPRQPVVAVSWFDAVAYCNWLSELTGWRYRLPTEAEWERAARGGVEKKLFPWGDEPPASRPSYHNRWKNGPECVGQDQNAFGLCEMCENVHEWCSDWFDPYFYSVSPDRNPRGPEDGARKASRGGSWRHEIKIARCSARSSIPPEFKYADYGFRIVSDCSIPFTFSISHSLILGNRTGNYPKETGKYGSNIHNQWSLPKVRNGLYQLHWRGEIDDESPNASQGICSKIGTFKFEAVTLSLVLNLCGGASGRER
jgi:formylglycine-generating enzyme